MKLFERPRKLFLTFIGWLAAIKDFKDSPPSEGIKILTVTWNMMGQKPSEADWRTTLLLDTVQHELYAIGSQECIESITKSMCKPSKQLIIDQCQNALGSDFFLVHSISLTAIHLVVFAHKRLAKVMSGVTSRDL